jgi:hypothetical protein
MFIALISLVIAATALVLILLAVVVVGIRRETRTAELSSRAPGLVAGLVRRLLGVGVRRPEPAADDRREACLAGHATGHSQEGESL